MDIISEQVPNSTFVESPSSTKNALCSRNQEAHQATEGINRHFGYKAHAGFDNGTRLMHTVEITAANVSDVELTPRLLRLDDSFCYNDASYMNVTRRPEVAGNSALSGVERHVARRRESTPGRNHPEVSWESRIEHALAPTKVEHAFRVVKNAFSWRKTCYCDLEKNHNLPSMAFALANLCLLSWAGGQIPKVA